MQAQTVRFESFELDVRAGELRKHGLKIRLQEQPFQVLRMLLQRPGEVVLRDEIRKGLWPNDTIVEFDHSINAAIQRLRDALGDSADHARYVETVARRGYRFVGAVEPDCDDRVAAVPEAPPAGNGLARNALDASDLGGEMVSGNGGAFAAEMSLPKAKDPSPARQRSRAWAVAFVLAVLVAGLAPVALLHFREKPQTTAAPVRFQILAPEHASLYPVLSPDGRKLVFSLGGQQWVHFLESGESRDLSVPAGEGAPFWSPDSRFIGYPSQGKLKKIEAAGGLPQTVTDLHGNHWGCGAWNQHDIIIFGERKVGLFRVPASGGVAVQITALDPARHEKSHYGATFLPDGRHFIYIRASTNEGKSAIYLGSVDAKPEQQSTKPLVASNWQPGYALTADPSTGYLLFIREGTLMAQPFDNRRLELKGQAAPVAEQITDEGGGVGSYAAFSTSASEVLVFTRRTSSDRQLSWYDRKGNFMGAAGEPGDYRDLALSPDGTRLSVTRARGADASNIWLLDLARGGASTRVTFGSASDQDPVWSPDGRSIIFSSNRDGPYNLYQKRVNGVKEEEVLFKSSEDQHATSWSRDGRFLLYTVLRPKNKSDLWVLPLEGDKRPVPFLIAEFRERQARFSPDGHWVAYTSDESGQDKVYVTSFSMNSARAAVEAVGKWPISNGFGVDPHWRSDGRELYYRSRDGSLQSVEIATNPAFRAGNPQPLGVLTFSFGASIGSSVWDSTADGKRFLRIATESGPQPYTVVMNWQAALKK